MDDRSALSELLMSIYDHGTLPNALREADAILTSDWLAGVKAGMLSEFVRGGVCLSCGGAVLNSGEHLDPERHAEWTGPTVREPASSAPAGCPFDGAAHEFEQRFNHERQDYYDACRKCGHEPSRIREERDRG